MSTKIEESGHVKSAAGLSAPSLSGRAEADRSDHEPPPFSGVTGSHDDGHHGRHSSPLAQIWSLLKTEKRDLWLVVIYAIGVGVFSLATPITAMAVVNTAAMATLLQQLLVFCIVLAICLGIGAFLRTLKTIVVEYLQQRIFVRVVGDLAYRLPRVDVRAFDQHHGPELVNRFFDVLTVQKAGATLLIDGVSVVLQTLVGLLLLAFYNQFLLGFDLILIAGLAALVTFVGRGGVATSIRESHTKYAVAGWLQELARHPTAFKLTGGQQLALERADALTHQYLSARQAHFRVVFRQFCFALGLQVAASTALLGLGGLLVIEEQLSLGQLVAAEIVVTMVVASFTKLGKQLESFYDIVAASSKLGHLMDLPLERSGKSTLPAASRPIALSFQEVTFRYDSRSERLTLSGLSFSASPGERLAIVGPNGAGKSTIVDLIFGMRRPLYGRIEIDDFDIRDMSVESLRDQVAVVKGIEIFEGTVAENIRMGRQGIGVAEIREALRAVRLLDDIMGLPEGLSTPLGTGGQRLSLGQIGRLMLARALVGRPRLLVLDETLDDADSRVRNEVLGSVLRSDRPWTLLVITHDESVARLCDRTVTIPGRGKEVTS